MPEWGQEQKGAILSRWFTRSRSERLCINSNFRTRKLGVSSANLCVLSQICGPDWICEIWNFQCGFSGTSGQGMGEFVKRNIQTFSFLRRTAIDMELRSDVSLTFVEAVIHMIGMFMIRLCGELEYWALTFGRTVIFVVSLSAFRGLETRLGRERIKIHQQKISLPKAFNSLI